MQSGAIDSILARSRGAPDLVMLSLTQKVQITNPKNGRVKTATVRDECPGCPSGNLGESVLRYSLR